MHILQLPSWYPADSSDVKGIFFREQALSLAAIGNQVGVLAPCLRPLKRALAEKNIRFRAITCEDDEGAITFRYQALGALSRIPYGKYYLWLRASEKLFKAYVNSEGWPDIIHAHASLYAGAVACRWKRKFGLPYVLTEHSTTFARNTLAPWQLRLARQAISQADATIAVSPNLGRLLDQKIPSNRSQWEWIPNMVSPRFEQSSAERPRSGCIRLLNLALMTEKKGQLNLLAAFARSFAGKLNVELWLGGDGPLRSRLEAESRRLKLESQVFFLGTIPPHDVPNLLNQVDIVVIASHYETFGLVAAEALMTGIPVVATSCGGPECIVREGDGYLAPPRSVQALSSALEKCVAQLPYFDGKAIAERARQRFSREVVTNKIMEVYDRILSGQTRKPPNTRV